MWLNKKNTKILSITLIIVIVLFLIVLQTPVRSFFYSASSPLQKWFWSKGLENSGLWSAFFNAESLKIENQGLESENKFLLSRIVELNQFRDENERLREALDLGLADYFNLLETNILSKDIVNDVILINKGEEDGISKGMPVITFQKILVGEIDEVYNTSSHVRLITDYKMKFSVEIEDAEIQALAKGQGNQKIILDLIPKDKELINGALVITSDPLAGRTSGEPKDGGPEGGFPKGLLVGEIAKIEKTDLTPFQKAEVSAFFNIHEASTLLVITNEL